MPTVLDAAALADRLSTMEGWTGDPSAIVKKVELPSFPAAIDVVTRVAAVAEDLNHHPDIDIRWRTLRFRLVTHSAGGVTKYDLALAKRIDDILATVFP